MTSKSELRKIFTERRAQAALRAAEYRRASEEMVKHLLGIPAWGESDLILGYVPMRGELDLRPLWDAARAAGKRIALPRTVTGTKEGRMTFSVVNLDGEDPYRELERGRYGILEPSASLPILEKKDMTRAICIVPGLAFDGDGYRLGYGGGYYDRFMKDFYGTSVGLALSDCCVTQLPHDEYDMAVSYVINEKGVRKTGEK